DRKVRPAIAVEVLGNHVSTSLIRQIGGGMECAIGASQQNRHAMNGRIAAVTHHQIWIAIRIEIGACERIGCRGYGIVHGRLECAISVSYMDPHKTARAAAVTADKGGKIRFSVTIEVACQSRYNDGVDVHARWVRAGGVSQYLGSI